jgi:hypothetical protein
MIETDKASAYLSAGFVEQLPTKEKPVGITPASSDVGRIMRFTSVMRNGHAARSTDVSLPRGTASEFSKAMKSFRACANYVNPLPECAPIYDIMKTAEKGTGPGGEQTDSDKDFLRSVIKLTKEFDSLDASALIARYQKDQISLSDFFSKLNAVTKDYDSFQQQITAFANTYYNHQLPKELKEAFHVMGMSMSRGQAIAQIQFFPLLEREILEVRLRRIEEAAALLSEHESDFPDGGAKEELRQLANDLACQNFYPIGPAFDRIKNNTLPHWSPKAEAESWSKN